MIIRYTSPARFMRIGSAVLPWCAWGSIAVIAVGLYLALITAPPDYQQGELRPHHVCPCPGGLDGAQHLFVCRRGKRRRPGLAPSLG